jgi:hypothetical protein
MNNLPITFKRYAVSFILTNSHIGITFLRKSALSEEGKNYPLISQINAD